VFVRVVLIEVATMSPKLINPEFDPMKREFTVRVEINPCVALRFCDVREEMLVLRPISVEKLEKLEM
jgi:hypothetical protein